jgi:hypothetical protein
MAPSYPPGLDPAQLTVTIAPCDLGDLACLRNLRRDPRRGRRAAGPRAVVALPAMKRWVLSLVLLAACGAKSAKPEAPGTPPPALIAKRVALSWGFEVHGEMSDVFLATTDETGKQVSHPLGRYKGTCSVIKPADSMQAMTGVACRTGPTGTELHAVVEHGQEIVILKLGIDEGVKQDPMAREEVTRVKVPLGTKIESGS